MYDVEINEAEANYVSEVSGMILQDSDPTTLDTSHNFLPRFSYFYMNLVVTFQTCFQK